MTNYANSMKPAYDLLSILSEEIAYVMFESKSAKLLPYAITITDRKGVYAHVTVRKEWDLNGNHVHEIALSPMAFNAGLTTIMTAIAHEFCHLANMVKGIEDVSKSGYHNKKFKDMCEYVGLNWEKGNKGYTTVIEDNPIFRAILTLFTEEEIALLSNIKKMITQKEPSPNKNLNKWSCPECGQKARAGKSANLICGICNLRMEYGKEE